jgi:uncharacterized protein (DUF2344 family)
MILVFSRAFERAQMPVAINKDLEADIVLSDPALIGIDSTCDICDVNLKENYEIGYIIKCLNSVLPNGIVVLSVEPLNISSKPIDEAMYAVVYEIVPEYAKLGQMNNKEFADLRMWYKNKLQEYMSKPELNVLVKSSTRNERINIKPAIIDYEIQLNDGITVTVSNKTDYIFSPYYIMDGFLEYIDSSMPYTIRKVKVLYR